MNDSERNGLQSIIDEAIEEMAREAGRPLDIGEINLAELCRKTGLTRSRARTLKAKAFRVTPHGRCGMKAKATVLTPASPAWSTACSGRASPTPR